MERCGIVTLSGSRVTLTASGVRPSSFNLGIIVVYRNGEEGRGRKIEGRKQAIRQKI